MFLEKASMFLEKASMLLEKASMGMEPHPPPMTTMPLPARLPRHAQRDQARRRVVAEWQAHRQALLAVAHDLEASPAARRVARGALGALSRDSAPTRLGRRCVWTGRGRGVWRRWRLSRLVVRDLAAAGCLPGVSRATW